MSKNMTSLYRNHYRLHTQNNRILNDLHLIFTPYANRSLMKILSTIFLLICLADAWAACSSPISRSNNSPNAVLTSTKYNNDLNTVYAKVNELDGDCITDATIPTVKYEDSSVTRAKLAVGAVAKESVSSKTANYTATSSDDLILVDSTSGNITVALPTAVGVSGKTLKVKKTDSSTKTVILDGNASETIDAATTVSLWKQYQFIEIVSDGINWMVINGDKCSSAALCETVFSARVTSAGVVTTENLDWINGSVSVSTSTFTLTFNTSIFTVAPSCAVTAEVAAVATVTKNAHVSSTSATTLVYYTNNRDNGGGTASAFGVTIVCQKQGADYLASKL
jgi:hypothetical protein